MNDDDRTVSISAVMILGLAVFVIWVANYSRVK